MFVPSLFASLSRFLSPAQSPGRDADQEINKSWDVSVKYALKLNEECVNLYSETRVICSPPHQSRCVDVVSQPFSFSIFGLEKTQ